MRVSCRHSAYSTVEACIFLPKIVAPAVAGVMAEYLGFTAPLCVAAGCSLGAVLAVAIIEASTNLFNNKYFVVTFYLL